MPYYPPAAASGAPIDATYITQTANGTLTAEQNLAALATGLLKSTTTTGALSIGVAGTDYPGLAFANVFTAAQTIQGATATVIPLTFKTTDDSTTNPLTRWISSTSASIAYIQKGEFWLLNTLTAPASLIAANRPTVLFVDTKAATAAGFVLQNQAADGYTEINVANNNAGASSQSRMTVGVGGTTAAAPYTRTGYIISFSDLDNLRIESRKTGSEIRFYAGHATNISHSIASDVSRFYMRDGATTALAYMTINHLSSNTPGTGFGMAILLQSQSSTTADQNLGRLSWEWATATHASRAALGRLTAYDISTERETIQWGVDGSNPTIGFLGATRIARQAHIVDADGNLADITTKFNSLLAYLENFGFIATS